MDSPSLPLDGLNVLIVDDEPALRRGVARLLRRLGATPAEAGDARSALVHLAESPVDAVLLDLGLPDGTSQLIGQLREASQNNHVSIVVLTGDDREGVRVEALSQGASGFLLKPVSSAVLAAQLAGGR